MNLSPSNSLVPNPLIRAIESCLGSCGIANLAILQLGKFSGGGGKGLSMGWFGLQGHKFMELASSLVSTDVEKGIVCNKIRVVNELESCGKGDGESWSTVVEEGEPVDASGSGATTSAIGAMTSGMCNRCFMRMANLLHNILVKVLINKFSSIICSDLSDSWVFIRATSAVVVIIVKVAALPTIVKVTDIPLGSTALFLFFKLDLTVLGCNPLALVDVFTPVEDNIAVMSSTSSAVTYTSVYTDSEPGRVFWGADKELSDGGSPRVIIYGYDGLPMQMPHDLDYVPEPMYPEYIPLQDEHVFLAKEQPLPPVVSPTAESPGYVESDPEEDPEEYEDDENGRIVGERLARCMAPSAHSSPPPVPSPLLPSSGCPTQIPDIEDISTRALVDVVTAALPLPPLPPSLYVPPPVDRRDDIPESELPPRKRPCLSTLGPREVGDGIRDTWVNPAEAVPEIAPMTIGEFNTRVTELSELHEHDTQDLYALLEDAHDSRTRISQRVTMDSQQVDLLIEDRIAHQETVLIAVHYELQTHRKQVYAHESQIQAHQKQLQLQGTLIQTQHQVHETRSQMQQTEMAELRETNRRHKAQMVEILRVMRDMRRETEDMQAELLALRKQHGRARQPGPDVRVPDHQDASRDADSHI
ncbi:hypothetical protein Tco_1523431 [Tanacetum coccineum]